jgi:hypothetical protein
MAQSRLITGFCGCFLNCTQKDVCQTGRFRNRKRWMIGQKPAWQRVASRFFGQVPRRELVVIQRFFYLASFIRPGSEQNGFIFMLNRALGDRLRVFLRHGLKERLVHLFSSVFSEFAILWSLATHPRIRKKYGLYLRNFPAQNPVK